MKKKIIVFAAFIISLLIILIMVIMNQNNKGSFDLDTDINSLTEGYNYAHNILRTEGKKFELIQYTVSYAASEINKSPSPLYYEYRFQVNEPNNENLVDNSIVRIDFNINKVYIFHLRKFDNLNNKGITIQDTDFNEIVRLLNKEFGDRFISSILELDEESIVCITKVFTGRTCPSSDWWEINCRNYSDISDDDEVSYFQCLIDIEGKQVIDTN